MPVYHEGIRRLEQLAEDKRLVIVCGEPMPCRCQRLLVANTLTVQGWTVGHLMGDEPPRRHELGRWGVAPSVGPDGGVTYPAELGAP